MLNPETTVRLLLMLIVLVYGYLVALGGVRAPSRIALAAVGLLPLAAWLLVPTLLDAGTMTITIEPRRLVLMAGGAAVALRYAALRSRERSHRSRLVFAAVSAALLLVAVTVAAANWLVAVGAAVACVASVPFRGGNAPDTDDA